MIRLIAWFLAVVVFVKWCEHQGYKPTPFELAVITVMFGFATG